MLSGNSETIVNLMQQNSCSICVNVLIMGFKICFFRVNLGLLVSLSINKDNLNLPNRCVAVNYLRLYSQLASLWDEPANNLLRVI